MFEDGAAATNVEGSWADAPVAAHLFGFMVLPPTPRSPATANERVTCAGD